MCVCVGGMGGERGWILGDGGKVVIIIIVIVVVVAVVIEQRECTKWWGTVSCDTQVDENMKTAFTRDGAVNGKYYFRKDLLTGEDETSSCISDKSTFFFFFAFPSFISGVHHFWVRFLRM